MSFGNEGVAFEPDDANNPLITKFVDATKKQQDAFKGTRMEVDMPTPSSPSRRNKAS